MSDSESVDRVIQGLVAAINEGRIPEAIAVFTDNPVIIEDIPPYRWEGADAPIAWLNAMAANAATLGVNKIEMTSLTALQLQVQGARAYAAYSSRLCLTKSDTVATTIGQLVFVLAKDFDWKIEALAWSAPEVATG